MKSDAKNSDVFERSEFRNFSQMSVTLSLFFDMEFSWYLKTKID